MTSTRGAVVLTGASTGIGRATALRLDREGFDVFAGVRREQDADSLRAEASDRLRTLLLDVTDDGAIAAAAAEVAQATGGKLAGLVNNAGIAVAGPIELLPIADFRKQIEVNLTGQVAVTQAMLPMLRDARGRIILISSIGGRMANPYMGAYHAAKFGLEAVGDSLRQEVARFGVQVAIIEPGAVSTPIWDKGVDSASATREHFGEGAEDLYGKQLDRMAELSPKLDAQGVAPEKVAEVIFDALTSARPKTRYLVGNTRVRVQAFAAKWFPDRLLDRIVARLIGV